MKTKASLLTALILVCSSATAAPTEGECQVTTAIDSPAATFVKLPLILSNPVTAFVFAASSYRNSLCPKPELITRQEAERMIQEAVAQHAECLTKGCPKTVVVQTETGEAN